MNFLKIIKKPITIKPFILLYIFNLTIILGIILGSLPREMILGSAFLIFLYLFLMNLDDCFLFFLTSIPFFVALPISRGFDSLNIWRIAIIIIFTRYFFVVFPIKNWFSLLWLKKISGTIFCRLRKNKVELWVVVYFLIGALSILVAHDKIVAIKRLFYVFQMILVYPLVLHILKNKKLLLKVIKYITFSGFLVGVVALIQLIFAYFTSLEIFWSFWAWQVEKIFYGQNLAEIVSKSNTWFSYYSGRAPTLRLFSTFTDSHSFALYLVLFSPLLLWFLAKEYLKDKKINKKVVLLGMIFLLVQFFIALSGTRGIWLSVGAPLSMCIYFLLRKKEIKLIKYIALGITSFIIVLLLSSPFLAIPQFNIRSDKIDQTLTLKRLKSIIDIGETSNKGRIYIWKKSVESILENPILGVGIGNFPIILGENVELQKAGSTAHNVYLNSGVEMGIIGLVVIVAIFLEILKKCYFFFREKTSNIYYLLPIFFGFYFLWIFTYSLFDVAIFDARVMMFFVAEVAIVIKLTELKGNNVAL